MFNFKLVANMGTETKKIYTSAPLPFMGQKRRFISDFKEAIKSFNNATTFVDLFGGSGLLSHIAKQTRPDARVIYNDYDDYHVRLQNINRTNVLLSDVRQIVVNVPRDKKIPPEIRSAILDRIYEDEQNGFVDYITLSSSLLFSMKYVTSYEALSKETMYNCVRKENYYNNGYLDGLEVVKYDYKELFSRFRGKKDIVFFIDPPYLFTEAGTYRCYWKLTDYLDVLKTLKDVSFIYFTSNKSSIIELLEWIDNNKTIGNPLKGAVQKVTSNQLTYNAKYKDIMLYKNTA